MSYFKFFDLQKAEKKRQQKIRLLKYIKILLLLAIVALIVGIFSLFSQRYTNYVVYMFGTFLLFISIYVFALSRIHNSYTKYFVNSLFQSYNPEIKYNKSNISNFRKKYLESGFWGIFYPKTIVKWGDVDIATGSIGIPRGYADEYLIFFQYIVFIIHTKQSFSTTYLLYDAENIDKNQIFKLALSKKSKLSILSGDVFDKKLTNHLLILHKAPTTINKTFTHFVRDLFLQHNSSNTFIVFQENTIFAGFDTNQQLLKIDLHTTVTQQLIDKYTQDFATILQKKQILEQTISSFANNTKNF